MVDGRSLKNFSLSEIRGLTSVVYQDFAKYYISLYNNIDMSPERSKYKSVLKSIDLMGLTKMVDDLPEGLDTPLGKILSNGVDLSIGQWQRLAMVRSHVSSSPLKILDEPTASLDPKAESELYENFSQITNNSTTILISHRLASTKLADIVYVIALQRRF